MPGEQNVLHDIPYVAPLLGNIRQILTGLQGFDSMAREIIQNADDAGAREIRFSIEQECLRIWNNEVFLSCGLTAPKCPWEIESRAADRTRKACDFHAISTVGSGNKYRDPSLIGRFGIGFVSVYQITDTPIVRSQDVQIQLDPLRERNHVTTVEGINGSEFELPWAVDANSPIRGALNASAIKREDLDSIQRDIVSVADDCLLFLRNLESIEVARDGKLIKRVTRKSSSDHRIRLVFSPEKRQEDWYVIHASAANEAAPLRIKYPAIERLARQTDIQIAFNLGEPEIFQGRLFAYLPTEQSSPVPCHINADFFPEQSRKALVLSGEQHERHWNEMLLGVAAKEISQHLVQLRNVLGPARLWKLIGTAFEHRQSEHFARFWTAIFDVAKTAEIVWGAGKEWVSPEKCWIAPSEMTTSEEHSLMHICVDLAHSSLRPFQNTLLSLGARRLTLAAMVDALEIWDESHLDEDALKGKVFLDSIVQPLWTATDALISIEPSPGGINRQLIARLQKIRFAPQADGTLAPMEDLYRSPSPISRSQIDKHIRGLPIVSDPFSRIENLYHYIQVLSFECLLAELAVRIADERAAKEFFGTDAKRIRQFYRFLSDYPGADEEPEVSSISEVPFLAGYGRFLKPTEAVLPGAFVDPIGRFNVLDISYYDERSQEFLKESLKVRVLTINDYIKHHLAGILKGGISDHEYIALFDQLTAHSDLLEDKDTLRVLRELPMVKAVDGAMRRPRDCYFRSAELAELLGDQNALWVDTSIFAPFKREVAKAFLTRLGMRSRPSLTHALDRIDLIVKHSPSEAAQATIGNVLHFVAQVFEEDNLADREDEFMDEIDRLRNTEWLPGSIAGNLRIDAWYAPHELHQPFRAAGFDSQVPVLAIKPNPRKPLTARILDFLEMPSEPTTSVVVDHLLQCSAAGIPPNELTYQILNERLRAKDDIIGIEKLKNHRSVYSPSLKRYLGTDRVFWSKPHIPSFCFQAPAWMHRYKELFDLLGVHEEPDGSTYSGVLKEIATGFGGHPDRIPTIIQLIQEICLKALSKSLRDNPSDMRGLLDDLVQHPFLITLAGTLAFADEVAVKDSDWLAEAFGEELNGRLIQPSPEYGEVIDRLRLKSLSAVTHLEAVRLGEEIADEQASERLAERRELLIWLFSGIREEVRNRICDALSSIQVVRSDLIQVRSVFALTDPAIVSTPKNEQALFERATNKLYLHLDLGDSYWIPALRAIFSTFLAGSEGVDVRQCALNASHVLFASSLEGARHQLEQAGFSPPSSDTSGTVEFDHSDLGDISSGTSQPESKDEAESKTGQDLADDETDGSDGITGFGASETAQPSKQEPHDGKSAELNTGLGSEVPAGASKNSSVGKDTGSPTTKSGTKRTQWMRSYVVPKGEKKDPPSEAGGQQERNIAIDEAAMTAVIEYEVGRQWEVERMPHFNPGYDIISRSKSSGERRVIEVKGIDGEWTGRGVKLSRTQIMNAEEYGDEYWLYVVEHALELNDWKIHAIQNPFFKADEFWFDYVWKDVADEHGGGLLFRFAPGRKVRIKDWGVGIIVDVQHRGIASSITVDFPVHGKKNLRFNPSRMELVEDRPE